MTLQGLPLVDETESDAVFTARWIGPAEVSCPNTTFLVRKTFSRGASSETVVLRVAADSRYAVYLNGVFVGNGPARGTDARYYFDSYDVSSALREGENTLAARVHCPVTPLTSTAPPIAPAFLAQLDGLAATDSSWQVRLDPAHRPDAPFYTHHIGYSEYRDLRKELVGWETGADIPAGWGDAVELASAHELGGRILSPRPIGPLSGKHYRPVSVMDFGQTPPHNEDVDDDTDYATIMQMEMHLKTSHVVSDNSEGLTTGQGADIYPAPRLIPGPRQSCTCRIMLSSRKGPLKRRPWSPSSSP